MEVHYSPLLVESEGKRRDHGGGGVSAGATDKQAGRGDGMAGDFGDIVHATGSSSDEGADGDGPAAEGRRLGAGGGDHCASAPAFAADPPSVVSQMLTSAASGHFHSHGFFGQTATPRSLFMCMVLENPFSDECKDPRVVDDELIEPHLDAGPRAPFTFMTDEQLLRLPEDTGSRFFPLEKIDHHFRRTNAKIVSLASAADQERHGENVEVLTSAEAAAAAVAAPAPNKFQKVMEVVLRLERRGIDVFPSGMLRHIEDADERAMLHKTDPNYYHGFQLEERNLLLAPAGEEMYLLLHTPRDVLLRFAEDQNIVMVTNRFSFGAGGGMSYSAELEEQLRQSVLLYARNFPIPKTALGKNKRGWGFRVEVPQKMRLTMRLLRESWRFGGCGLPVDQMRFEGILVKNVFPLHNPSYLRAHGMHEWGSFRSLFTSEPLKQDKRALVSYFGEHVALYFIWIRKYTLFQRYAAIVGVLVSTLDFFNVSRSVLNGAFSLFIMTWGVAWIMKWQRTETLFASEFGQEIEQDQELVRDDFKPISIRNINVDDIFELKFSVPTTLQRNSDGTMIEKYYPPRLRMAVRALVTYPIVLVLTVGMIWCLIAITRWRFDHHNASSDLVTYGASAITVLIGIVFGRIFDFLVPLLNKLENNRTETEEENQRIIKSFFFYFFSSYFALFAIALWPLPSEGYLRLVELQGQMLVITVAKPMVQNVQEFVLPWLMTHIRRRVDATGGYCPALASFLCCRTLHGDILPPSEFGKEGRRVWKEAQREPFDSTAEDHLEIALQFGYNMFVAVFPWTALASLLYNVIELRVDARKMLKFHQRPIARTAKTIGAWNWIFGFLSILIIVTNSYLVCVLSPAPGKFGLPLSEADRLNYFCIMQYTAVALVILAHMVLGSQPEVIRKKQVKSALLRDRAICTKITALLSEKLRMRQAEERVRRKSVSSAQHDAAAAALSVAEALDTELLPVDAKTL